MLRTTALRLVASTCCAAALCVAQAPEDASERAVWIGRQAEQVRQTAGKERDDAIAALAKADVDGDCVQPLAAIMRAAGEDLELLVAVARGLGRDGLRAAAPALCEQLAHADDGVRANAAVSLEYVGSDDKDTIAALKRQLAKEKVVAIENHLCRALGRCGRQDGKVRALLLKQVNGAKSEVASFGPLIGLAYFEGDEKAARGVEKVLKKIGVPGVKGQVAAGSVERALASWTLAAIGSKKSGPFVREELLARIENVRAVWVGGMRLFWTNVAEHLEGPDDKLAEVADGVRGTVTIVKRFAPEPRPETSGLMDDARKGREDVGFRPVGDGVLTGA